MQVFVRATMTVLASLCLMSAARPDGGAPALAHGRGSSVSTNCPEKPLPAPRQVAPRSGQTYGPLPHTTKFAWTAVRGARHYAIEIDCFQCCGEGRWCAEIYQSWHVKKDLTVPGYEYIFEKPRAMRWRVRALDRCNHTGAASGWLDFTLTTQAPEQ